ncbi:MAG: hypothetical protein MJ158_02775 [Alphaproteobacteria bacterium]|nr:hypothetical protein [Alphaproteobacteria bacterium]
MLKKIILGGFLIVGISANVFAVPTVRKLGGTTANTVKPNNTAKTSVLSAKAAKVPATASKSAKSNTSAETVARMPTAHAIKKLGGSSFVKKTSSTPTSGETDESITELKERVTVLEDRTNNIITEVEATEGNYINDINIDGNKLEVNKTRVLYAPVKKANGDTTADDAEIWIVR